MDYQTKIQILEKKIKDYQEKHPQRDWIQKHKLNALWLELVYWQLVEKGEVKPDPLFFKVKEFWQNLKKSHQAKGRWSQAELEAFLARQPSEYTEYLISLIQQETKPEYLKLAQRLSKKIIKTP
jgi:hypothetical protein